MLRRFLLIAGILLCQWNPLPASAAIVETAENWQPRQGDIFVADLTANIGYLIHADATYLPFLIASGQQRYVYYLGQRYFAATPRKTWVAKEQKIQPDRINFGASGRFLRLFDEGTEYTSYGIHSYKYISRWLSAPNRYKSLGCIVVTEDIMDILAETFALNGKELLVITTDGPNRLFQELTSREQQMQANREMSLVQ